MKTTDLSGVGLGLRWEFLQELLEKPEMAAGAVRFFEVAPENYMRRGGYFPASLAKVAEQYPVTTHGLMMSLGGTDPLDESYLRELRSFLNGVEGSWHSDHLAFGGLDGATLHDLLPVPFTRSSARNIADRVRRAEDRLRRPLAVENISYYVELEDPGEAALTEPEFICEILDRAGCRLLLDLNNLDVNAQNHGFDPWEWLRQIPLDRVVEIHVAGPEMAPEGVLIDTHGSDVAPRVYEMLRWVVERRGPLPVLLERDNNIPTLAELVSEVRRIDEVYHTALTVHLVGRELSCTPPTAHTAHTAHGAGREVIHAA